MGSADVEICSAAKIHIPMLLPEEVKRGAAEYLYRMVFIYSRSDVVPEWTGSQEVPKKNHLLCLETRSNYSLNKR